MKFPPLFVCEICQNEVDPKSSFALQMVTGWVRMNKRTLAHLSEKHPRYVHEHCLEISKQDNSPTLW
jgi:hypothetical protein